MRIREDESTGVCQKYLCNKISRLISCRLVALPDISQEAPVVTTSLMARLILNTFAIAFVGLLVSFHALQF